MSDCNARLRDKHGGGVMDFRTEKRISNQILVFTLVFVLLSCTSQVSSQTQRASVVYNISDASEALDATSLLAQISSLSSVTSLSPLTASTVTVDSCPAGTYSPVDSQTCTLCPVGKYSTFITATSIDTCVSCGAGKYSNALGASSETTCRNCPADTYFTGTGAPSISSCVACPQFSSSYEGAPLLQWCICLPGYSGHNGNSCTLLFTWRDTDLHIVAVMWQEVLVRCAIPRCGASTARQIPVRLIRMPASALHKSRSACARLATTGTHR